MQSIQSSTNFKAVRNAARLTIADAANFLNISAEDAERLERGLSTLTFQQFAALNCMVSLAATNPQKSLPLKLESHVTTQKLARKENLAQYFTPTPISKFMADMFDEPRGEVKLLDAGAGEGALSIEFIKRWGEFARISIEAHEVDPETGITLKKALSNWLLDKHSVEVVEGDFIERATNLILSDKCQQFTHVVLNPPYKKISAQSNHRKMLSSVGLETVNLYSGFVAMAVGLAAENAEIVAIIPRSFCNGPYYFGFRKYILSRCALTSIHIFEKRDKAFAADGVLQENVIIKLRVGVAQSKVKVSTSSDQTFADIKDFLVEFDQIVKPRDNDLFIHIPVKVSCPVFGEERFNCSLSDLGLQCSTGPVVDFRAIKFLKSRHEPNSAPLLYPCHFEESKLVWPSLSSKKPNAIEICDETKKMLLPMGHYVVVRRFSSKEERRRIHAGVLDPNALEGDLIGIENHLNYFHSGKNPIDIELCWGLTAYLMSSHFDTAFRSFSGHTQVNATDLRKLQYPAKEKLMGLGRQLLQTGRIEPHIVDRLLEKI